jgi:uncharacterized protein YndB with AHSA1/START domain
LARREKSDASPSNEAATAADPSVEPREVATSSAGTTVRSSAVVNVDVETAFRVFTEGMTSWWPPEHHIGEAPMLAAILEPRVGGRWYEFGTDGSECEWGVVLAFDPPNHVAVSWHLDGDFHRFDPDMQRASRVDVRFRAQDDGTTLVELEHSGLDHHGPSWRRLRDRISSPGGWSETLRRFAAVTAGGTHTGGKS